MMDQLMTDLMDRADSMPWMTAFQLGGQPITYGELADSLAGYHSVAQGHGLSSSAAVHAAVTSAVVELSARQEPAALADTVGSIVDWLSRRSSGEARISVAG